MTDLSALEAVFSAAVAILDPAERAAYLDGACRADPALRGQLERLLAAHPGLGHFLDPPTPPAADTPTVGYEPAGAGPADLPGTVLGGRYELLKGIGEGGMGSVWMARQTEPVCRLVAVKLVKAGMDSKGVLARFEVERQALAMMDHPHIARVFDGGTTPAGQPFFVMELVSGVPITDYCDRKRLSVRKRLGLFVDVCRAVQHAHQKGVIHRDLKPSNVLVAEVDDRSTPKVIDFGVAKATGGVLTEKTIDTGFGGVVGTPLYMSPEQATFNNLDVDTRSDVYGLGVLLYELLAGSPPFARKELEKKGLLEILRVVREEEPPRPSTKLTTADALATLSANRGTEPKKLTDLLRSELDWIVMKALEKDRGRRYDTANGLALDVQRYLADEVVEARPPSRGYRLRKFARRHRGQVLAAGLVLAALLAGMGSTTWGLIQARQSAEAERIAKIDAEEQKVSAEQFADAERVAKLAAQHANDLTAERLRQIELINNSVFDIFAGFDIRKHKKGNDPIEYVLAKKLIEAGHKLDEKAIHDPLVLAALRNRLGETLSSLGEFEAAVGFFIQAREIRTARLGADHPDTLTSMGNLAAGYRDAGKLFLALPLLIQTLEIRRAKLGADHPDTLHSVHDLAWGYGIAGKLDLALPLGVEALKLRRAKLGADHPDTLHSMNLLALGYKATGKPDLALPLYEETLQLRKARLGADHPDTLTSMNNLAIGYDDAGKHDRALPLFEETLKLMRAKLGGDHPDTLTSMNNLAGGYRDAGERDRALPLFEETVKLMRAKLPTGHPDTLRSTNNLANAYKDAGKHDLALPLFQEAATGIEKLRFQHLDAGGIVSDVSDCHEHFKQFDQAEVWRRKGVAVAKEQSGVASPDYAGALAALGWNLLQQQKWTDAELVLCKCLAIREKQLPDDWRTFNTYSLLGGALLGQKKYAGAEPLLLRGCEGMKEREKTIPKEGGAELRIPQSVDRLVELYTATNQPVKATKWRAERASNP